ncbi:hypothetical protein ACFL0F_00125 [Patescibacteria group bacterium]
MNNRGNCSTPFAAGLLGGLIGTVFTLSAVYISRQENRKRLAMRFEDLKQALSEEKNVSKKKLAGNLKKYAKQLES